MTNMDIWRLATLKAVGMSVILAASVAMALPAFIAFGQSPDDPASEPIPTIEPFTKAESIVTQVVFNGPIDVDLVSGTVSHSPPPALIGGPPLIKVEVFDTAGRLLLEFNEWHPLWIEAIDQGGDLEMIVEESGEGRFVFPFWPDIGDVVITDIELNQELIVIDAHQIVLAYCAASPSDPGCASVPGPGQLPDTGGTSSDGGGFSSLLWIAAIAAAIALAGASAATWLTRQRRRAR